MNLTKTTWPLGWTPSADAINGNPEGLLRMDNLRLDKNGNIGLVDGIRQVPFFSGNFVSNIFSKIVNGTEYFVTATGLPNTSVTRTNSQFGQAVAYANANGGIPNYVAAFGDALGYILATSGQMRVKDDLGNGNFTTAGNRGAVPLGLRAPNNWTGNPHGIKGPVATVNAQQILSVATDPNIANIILGGQNQPGGIVGAFIPDKTALELDLAWPCNSTDTTNIGNQGAGGDIGNDTVRFKFTVGDQPASVINYVEVDFLLDGNFYDPSTYQNYYYNRWDSELIQVGLGTQATLTSARGDFKRVGNDTTLDWSKVIGVRYVVSFFQFAQVEFGGSVQFVGGIQGGLNGVYNYIQQSVYNDGHYLAKSPVSWPAQMVNNTYDAQLAPMDFIVLNGSVTLTPNRSYDNYQYANEWWFFRKASNTNTQADPNTGEPLNQSVLDQYYFVGKSTDGTPFTDNLTDNEVLQLNADGSLLPNLYLQTLDYSDPSTSWFSGGANALTDYIYDMEGMFNERMLYMGAANVYLSDRINPDAVDVRFTLKPSGDPTEKNLWIRRLTNDVIILATTKTLYEISGTLLEAPDGSLDVNIINLGEAYPPLGIEVTNFNGGLYYIASDGLRVTTGSNSINVSPQLRHLFESGYAAIGIVYRHGMPGVSVYDGIAVEGGINYSITSAHGKIYFSVPMQDATRRVFVYDTITQTYEMRYTDPVKLYTTQAGEVYACYGNPSNSIFILDWEAGQGVVDYNQSPINGIPFLLRTVFDSNGQPRNRKDTFTLKLIMDSGNQYVSVDIQKDGAGVTEFDEPVWTNLGQFTANGQTTIYIPLNNVSLGFRYSIQLSNANGLNTFKLYEMTIEYEPRPEQLDYLRLLPTNLGTISRKRITSFAFVIDTLGNNIKFQPNLDNVAWPSSGTINTTTKQTYIFYFLSEAICTDIGGILSGGVFEFYQLNLEECVSEKLPVPVEYLIIPANNYGTPNRKRHTSYKFQILTRGQPVQFTPILDGTSYQTATYTTSVKQTVEYFFPPNDDIGIDVGGILQSISQPPTPFEFYGVITPQNVEVLPPRLEYYRIPNTNYGLAARKRIRTMPMVIDTYGQNVTFTPIVDGINQNPTIINTTGKTTAYHYFNTDIFGTDFGGIVQGSSPFEFYELSQPESVEALPVPKVFDQLGPMRFDKIGKLFGFRIKMIMNGSTTSVPFAFFDDRSLTNPVNTSSLYSGTFPVIPGTDQSYEVLLPKSVNADVVRLVIGPTTDTFHRYDVYIKVQLSGMETHGQWRGYATGGATWLPIR